MIKGLQETGTEGESGKLVSSVTSFPWDQIALIVISIKEEILRLRSLLFAPVFRDTSDGWLRH